VGTAKLRSNIIAMIAASIFFIDKFSSVIDIVCGLAVAMSQRILSLFLPHDLRLLKNRYVSKSTLRFPYDPF
jgi:hypothetical protein